MSSKERTTEFDRYEEFVRLLIESEPRVRGYLRGMLPSWDDVEEALQEASLIAWRKFDSFEPDTSFAGWFLTIARFEALKVRRRVARSPLIFQEDVWALIEQDDDEEEPAIELEQLERCLGRLDPARRRVVLQAHSPGVKLRDLARDLGVNEQAFYKSIQRVRRRLLDCINRVAKAEAI